MTLIHSLYEQFVPKYDHSSSHPERLFSRYYDESEEAPLNDFLHWFKFGIKAIGKPAIRGGIVGAALGTGIAYVTKIDVAESIGISAGIIGGIDFIQYGLIRGYLEVRKGKKNAESLAKLGTIVYNNRVKNGNKGH